ncbi:AMP-binding protein [Solirubrobacter ginsenosidimutans]|uniref:AMP-binding protein n=1 Tax=Solirubrobacter ginsenosidimutans TaxID=490573 RepID=A0A9X3MQ27_9ACTN|nr:AMP-binding protein [Solirubrobacter ginsenosidimutans]MDA0160344.1 AMP-binding protein [Solirubrobacter ginsenosidimutans]
MGFDGTKTDDHGLERSRRMVFGELLARSARRVPGKVALVFQDRTLTYAELDERVNRAANALTARGVRRGDHVGLLMHNRPEVLEVAFACHRLGACAVPVSPRLRQAEVDHVLRHSRVIAIVSDHELSSRGARAAAVLPAIRAHLALGDPAPGAHDYEAALATASPVAPDVLVDDDDTAYVMYTSGTTGRAKGVLLSHRNLTAQLLNFVHEVGAREDDVWLSEVPMSHIVGLGGLFSFLYLGATVVIMPSAGFDPARTLERMHELGVTACFFTPSQWERLCRVPEPGAIVPSLRVGIWGAALAMQSTLTKMNAGFPGVELLANFGQTEMSPSATWLKARDAERKLGSVGRLSINVEARVIDDDGNDVAPGEVGEIVYRGPTVMKGYFDDAAATRDAFHDGWFHSGDLVYQDEEGFFYVAGRKADVIFSGGRNIYPAEIEQALLGHPAVVEAAVIGVPHPQLAEAPLAVVVTRLGTGVADTELMEHLRERLPDHKLPASVEFVDALPRNSGGSVLRRELRAAVSGS